MDHPLLGATLLLLACSESVSRVRADEDSESIRGPSTPIRKIDKSGYHLLNPTPREFMRELSADRPDKTESAYTVDAGHFQIEMDVLTYARDHDTSDGADTRAEGWAIAPFNLKIGLLNSVDLQTVIETYSVVETDDRVGGTSTRQSGFGDVSSRIKVSLWGNDGGSTALSVMPYVKWPTNQDQLGNHSIEGGIILPMAVELPWGFGMGIMPQVDFIRNESRDGHHAEFVNTITVGRQIIGNVGMYIEFFSLVSTEGDSPWVGTFDLGITYGLTQDIQLDIGVNIGVTDSADDINPFLGITMRF